MHHRAAAAAAPASGGVQLQSWWQCKQRCKGPCFRIRGGCSSGKHLQHCCCNFTILLTKASLINVLAKSLPSHVCETRTAADNVLMLKMF